MVEERVGARELKARLGRYLRMVREGSSIVITDRGKPIGRIVPFAGTRASHQEWARELADMGLVEWSGEVLEPMEPPARLRGDKTVAELLVEDRE
ncbi:MAG: type II toxin-antitoxin system prevent-host-death family antitoxin [Anaerolineae bacterium]|nr:type II toxin-antitoxin system prevent-host-death family antitoxin [Anaerolineae bacterium]